MQMEFRPNYNSDGLAHPTNGERAGWADEAVKKFVSMVGEDEPRVNIQDLITDLGHLADKLYDEGLLAEDEDFEQIVQWALENWREER